MAKHQVQDNANEFVLFRFTMHAIPGPILTIDYRDYVYGIGNERVSPIVTS